MINAIPIKWLPGNSLDNSHLCAIRRLRIHSFHPNSKRRTSMTAPTRNFGRPRLSQTDLKFTLPRPAFRGSGFKPLPAPTGPAPFHLDLQEVIDKKLYKAIADKNQMVFHISGDIG